MSKVVRFPLGEEAAADAYLAWCDANNPDLAYDPQARWYDVVTDANGCRIVGYLGPGGRPDLTDEPEGGEQARGPGVVQDGFERGDVEE